MSSIISLLQGIASRVLVLGLLIFFHELGHYLAARWRGIHVEAFSIGFGPALVSWVDRHETVWKLCVLPLGGFVKMHGMTLNVAGEQAMDQTVYRDGQAFFQKSVLSRAIVVAAGPIANFLLAAILFTGLYAAVGIQVPLAVVGEVTHGGSAETAGLRTGDVIAEVDGAKIADFDALRRVVAVNAGHTLKLSIHRGSQDLTIPVLIKPASAGDLSVGRLGVSSSPGAISTTRLGPISAVVAGVTQTGSVLWQILTGLVHIITTGQGVHDLGGPIAMVVISGEVAKLGMVTLIGFVAALSINLGLVNLLPIPILDGGHLMFYAAEALRGRPLPARAMDYGYRLGFAIIASLFVFISWNDLVHTGAVHWVAHLIG